MFSSPVSFQTIKLLYVLIAETSMAFTLRQRVLKLVYPLFLVFKKIKGSNKLLKNENNKQPDISFYSLSVLLNKGNQLALKDLKGKKVLIVNTASDCGYTNQYKELQELYDMNKDHLEIIGFPSNDFKHQEKGTDEEIERFCTANFGIHFPLAKKSVVIKDKGQNSVFQWLTNKEQNGWNDQPPTWNFSKYLVNEQGILTHYFDPAVSPLSNEVMNALQRKDI